MKCNVELLLEKEDEKIVDSLRTAIYEQDYRVDPSEKLTYEAHVTIALTKEIPEIDGFVRKFKEIYQSFRKISVHNKSWILENIENPPSSKCPVNNAWIAIRFIEPLFKEIYEITDQFLTEEGVNDNETYIASVKKNVKRVNPMEDVMLFDCIANHLNLSNRTKVDKSKEVENYFKEKLPKSLTFSRIRLRGYDGITFCEIPLLDELLVTKLSV